MIEFQLKYLIKQVLRLILLNKIVAKKINIDPYWILQ
jgi:hypothetical protein